MLVPREILTDQARDTMDFVLQVSNVLFRSELKAAVEVGGARFTLEGAMFLRNALADYWGKRLVDELVMPELYPCPHGDPTCEPWMAGVPDSYERVGRPGAPTAPDRPRGRE